MSLAISAEHTELAASVRRWASARDLLGAARSMLEADRDVLPAFWTECAELGFIGLAVSAVMLKHKADDVMAEVTMVGQRVDELRTLVAQLELPPRSLK